MMAINILFCFYPEVCDSALPGKLSQETLDIPPTAAGWFLRANTVPKCSKESLRNETILDYLIQPHNCTLKEADQESFASFYIYYKFFAYTLIQMKKLEL